MAFFVVTRNYHVLLLVFDISSVDGRVPDSGN